MMVLRVRRCVLLDTWTLGGQSGPCSRSRLESRLARRVFREAKLDTHVSVYITSRALTARISSSFVKFIFLHKEPQWHPHNTKHARHSISNKAVPFLYKPVGTTSLTRQLCVFPKKNMQPHRCILVRNGIKNRRPRKACHHIYAPYHEDVK